MTYEYEAEPIAAAFHEAYERLAPTEGYETREASAVPWDQVPELNRRLMCATVADLLERGIISAPGQGVREEAGLQTGVRPYPSARELYVPLLGLAVQRAGDVARYTGRELSPDEIRDYALLWLGSVPA